MKVAIIPARGGSQRIKNKNIRDFHGKPIIAYSIEKALKAGCFDQIVVTTDSKEIADVAWKYGASYVHDRPERLGKDEVGTFEVAKDVVEMLDLENDDEVCVIYSTAPLMNESNLFAARLCLHNHFHVISVGYPPLQDAAQFYWSKAITFKKNLGYWTHKTAPFHIEPERVCDINYEEDWYQAEEMYALLYN